MTIETLICTDDDHQGDPQWTRERKRGVKPKICPTCRAANLAALEADRAERAEAEHLIGGIITVAAVRAIQSYREWLKEDAYLFGALVSGEIDRSEWLELRTPCPDVNSGDFPSGDTWKAAEAANLI